MKLETQRLIIRPFERGDAQQAHAFFALPQVMGPLGLAPAHTTLAQTEDRLAAWIAHEYHSAVVLKDSGALIGYIAVNPDSEAHREDTRELGYALHPHYQGFGYMSEAVTETLRFLRRETDVKFVWACCFEGNPSSKALIERCGFEFQTKGEYFAQGEEKTYPSLEYRMQLER